jgi:hypothetical protein
MEELDGLHKLGSHAHIVQIYNLFFIVMIHLDILYVGPMGILQPDVLYYFTIEINVALVSVQL